MATSWLIGEVWHGVLTVGERRRVAGHLDTAGWNLQQAVPGRCSG